MDAREGDAQNGVERKVQLCRSSIVIKARVSVAQLQPQCDGDAGPAVAIFQIVDRRERAVADPAQCGAHATLTGVETARDRLVEGWHAKAMEKLDQAPFSD